ncbi:MAG: sigma-70 family RNA polymerase sigma factor [Coleofasciculus sp. D1-CHI-01]|uniref:sigma-70 family RNA polymerase sigma factor n=1 Tax=Coleofasciculus sp. D1-CHI-01 TaxID=3068482 RepID=UPI0032F63BD3
MSVTDDDGVTTHPKTNRSKSLGNFMDADIDQQLRQLVAQTCQYPRRSLQRRRSLDQLIRAIAQSGKLWQENSPDYEEALQQTWLYLCRKIENYNPERATVITWLDAHLKQRLKDLRWKRWQYMKRHRRQPPPGWENPTDPIENLPDTHANIPPILEETLQWAESDPDGELSSAHIKGRPDITCQVLILHRLPPETKWVNLETELKCKTSTLATFYQRHCVTQLREFGESQGYL